MACEHKNTIFVPADNGWRVLCKDCGLGSAVGFDREAAGRMWTEFTGCDAPSGEFDPGEIVQGVMGIMKDAHGRAQGHSCAMIVIYEKIAENLEHLAAASELNAIARVVAAGIPVSYLMEAEEIYLTATLENAKKALAAEEARAAELKEKP